MVAFLGCSARVHPLFSTARVLRLLLDQAIRRCCISFFPLRLLVHAWLTRRQGYLRTDEKPASERQRRTIPESCDSMQLRTPLFDVPVILTAALINWTFWL